MVREYQDRGAEPVRLPKIEVRSTAFRLAASGIALACIAAATGFLLAPSAKKPLNDNPQEAAAGEQAQRGEKRSAGKKLPPNLFQNWPKPDVAILLSGQQHGFLQPCGCSPIQIGGLARRYNFMKILSNDLGWPVLAADLGDIAQAPPSTQAMLKYVYSMRALKLMSYTGAGIGENEINLPLVDALSEYALNDPSPRALIGNVGDVFPPPAPSPLPYSTWAVGGGNGAPKVGFIAMVDDGVAKNCQKSGLKFNKVQKELPLVLAALKQKENPDFVVLLLQGTLQEARAIAPGFPDIRAILYVSDAEEPPGRPQQAGNAALIEVGHKGRSVGVLGVWKPAGPGQPFKFRYQLVALDPVFETPQGQDATNPIHALLQKYAQEVKDQNLLTKHPKIKHSIQRAFPNAKYVGSEKCKKCHQSAYDIWKKSPHAHAYDDLVQKAKRPTLRQYDPECIVCHVVGYDYHTGFQDEKATPFLKDVGCENCHGPASEHIKNKNNMQVRLLMNPWKPKKGDGEAQKNRLKNQMDQFCQKCHDTDNDTHWDYSKNWPKIEHPTPPAEKEE